MGTVGIIQTSVYDFSFILADMLQAADFETQLFSDLDLFLNAPPNSIDVLIIPIPDPEIGLESLLQAVRMRGARILILSAWEATASYSSRWADVDMLHIPCDSATLLRHVTTLMESRV